MHRSHMAFLEKWMISSNRKPLVIRGARQVGKTWLVRHLAQVKNYQLLELNFEKQPALASHFKSNDPQLVLRNLSAALNTLIDPTKSLLFLDEIQAAPEILGKLRWFSEDLPQLAVIAAGSLLEFVLEQPTFSMPVGRINMIHLEPLSFEEFLLAKKKFGLLEYIKDYQLAMEIPKDIHESLMMLFKEYLIIGGMPAAVSSWVEEQSLLMIQQIHQDLLATYRADFFRYRGRLPAERLEEGMAAIPRHLGEKIIYSKINHTVQASSIRQALDLLCKGRIIHPIYGCSANGIPLAAERMDKYMKMLFLDVGLCSASLGLQLTDVIPALEIALVNRGGIAEQAVGQLLRTLAPPFIEPSLYYWHREEKGASSEIDYVIQQGACVLPIEVKAGATGSLKSLHLFMSIKKLQLAVRINSDYPSVTSVKLKTTAGDPVSYTLISLPFYLVEQTCRLAAITGSI